MATQTILAVQSVEKADVYKDLVRIPELHRGGISEGKVCKLSVPGKGPVYRSIRGLGREQSPVIGTDELTRKALGLHLGRSYAFLIEPVGWWGRVIWAWDASDPAARLMNRLTIVGLALALIAVFELGKSALAWMGITAA